jgi:malonyl-CoA/methylmalonyl-CoA synthetase
VIIGSEGTFTPADLDVAARRVARGLLEDRGAADLAEGRVAFFVAPGFGYAAVERGIWLAGGVAVPLALSHPPAELDYVVRDAGAEHVVADAGGVAMLHKVARAAGARVMTTAGLLDTAAADPARLPAVAPGRRAMILYTSGSTGRPKGVVSTHASLAAQIGTLVNAWGWTPADRLLLVLPLHHVHGIVNGLGSALAAGATCEVLPAFDAVRVWERFASGEITVFTAVPTIYRRLIDAWDAAGPADRTAWTSGARRARLMMSGSAALPVTLFERWREVTGQTLLERYGMTEVGMALSNPLVPVGSRRPGFVGSPLPGVDVRRVDDHGAVVSGDRGDNSDEPGELEIRGPGVFLEYWRRPDETRAAFRDGWFRTGDIAQVEDGVYRILGRANVDIIKTGGFKVSALEIEDVLRAHPAVADCAVVGVADDEWGERVSACVQLAPGTAISLDALRDFARPRLAPYKLPRAMRTVDALPRNAMGKVVKPDVAALFDAAPH